MPVAALCENSIAIGKGTATHSEVTIPSIDQLGTTRPATPSIGAVEYGTGTGIAINQVIDNSIQIWNDNNQLIINGADVNAMVVVFDLTGKQVYKGIVNEGIISLDIEKGVYIAKVNNTTAKLMIK